MKKTKKIAKNIKPKDSIRPKLLLILGIIVLIAFLWMAFLMFAMRDGPLGAGSWILAAVLLLGGSGLIWFSRRA
jgi:hypothetical protein